MVHVLTDLVQNLFLMWQNLPDTSEINKYIEHHGKGFVLQVVFEDCLPFTLTTITRIVNNSFFTNTFARAWKTAEITPILKCGTVVQTSLAITAPFHNCL